MEILNSEKFVYVEFDSAFRPIRIFRNREQAARYEAWTFNMVKIWSRTRATAALRRRVFDRDDWACVHCGTPFDWQTGEMHERWHRGDVRRLESGEYQGGEISMENSEARCRGCHTGPGGAHDRRPQWSEAA